MGDSTSEAVVSKFVETFLQRATYQADLFHPDATVWHNLDETDIPLSTSVQTFEQIRGVVPDFCGNDIVASAFEDGFVVRFVYTGTLPDGGPLRFPACIVGSIEGGKIQRLQEYVDAGQSKPLADAFVAAMSPGA